MSKKITDLGFGTPNDSSLGFIGDPSSGALSKSTYITLKNYFQSGSSLLLTGSYVTTASFNSFSSSYSNDSASFYLIEHNLQLSQSSYVLTSTYLPFSGSYSNDSSSFDARIKAISGSMLTGSFVTTLTFNVFSGSVASNFSFVNTQLINVFSSESNYLPTSSFNAFSSSFVGTSSSINIQIANIYASESGYVLTSSYLPFSSSYHTDSASFYNNILNTYLSESKYLLTSSISGNNSYFVLFSGSQGLSFGSLYQSGSAVIIGGVSGILPGVGLQVNGQIYQNDTTATRIGSGNTVQRPSGSLVEFGMIRGNTDTTLPEWFNGVSWVNLNGSGSISGSGSVTSVGLSLPSSLFNVSNTPVVGAGVISSSFNSFPANQFLASPSGSAGVPSMRGLSIIDIAPLTSSFIGNFVTVPTFNTLSSSYSVDSGSFNNRINNVFASESNYTPLTSFNSLSSSYHNDSSSYLNIIANTFSSESNYLPTSSFNAFSSSFVGTSASISTQITNTFSSESNYLPTSSINGNVNFIPVFSGSISLTSSVLYQSGSSILVGTSTGSNQALLQVHGGLSVSGPIYDSTNSTGSITQVLSNVPGGLLWTSTGSGFWSLSGNTISSGSFLGTINSQDLIFKRNNIQMGLFTSNNSIVLGNSNNTVSGSNSIVLGGSTNMANTMAAVIAGGNNIANGNSSVVVGGQNSIVIGVGAITLGGTNLSASSAYSVVAGRFNDPISGSNSVTWVGGDPLLILGNGSSASSLSNAVVIYKTGSIALPYYASSSLNVLSVDNNGYVNNIPFYPSNSISNDSSSFNTRINNVSSSALSIVSYNTQISGSNGIIPLFSGSHGLKNSVLSQLNIASGSVVIVSGSLQNFLSNAIGGNTVAFGNGNSSYGTNSFVHGNINSTLGFASHAEGNQTNASGDSSHAEGVGTNAIGSGSHAEGSGSQALGSFSHVEGIGTIASGSGQTVLGRYNNFNNTSSIVIIGNGISGSQRSDLVTFNQLYTQFNSDLYLSGSLHISNSIFDSSNNSGLPGQVMSSTGTGIQWSNVSGSSLFSGYLPTSSFNIFSSSYATDSSSFNTRIINVFLSESNYTPTSSFNALSSSLGNIQGYVLTSSIKGIVNVVPLFAGTASFTSSIIYQSGSTILIGGNTTGSNNAILQAFGNIYISRSIYDSTNSTGSLNQVLSNTPTGVKWVTTGSGGGSTTGVLNFIIGDGGPFTPLSGSTQFSASGNPLVGRTVLQFFQEGALFAPVSRSVEWYSFSSSQGIINAQNFTFDVDTFYSILYT